MGSDGQQRWAKTDPEAFRQQVIEYLRERRADGHRHVKSSHVETHFGVMPQRAGNALGVLEDRGVVSYWGNGPTQSPNTYVIEVEADA
jgi:hypothetical protein